MINTENSSGNRLSRETSPYLLQHADNPVDWHPWGPEALTLAREMDRPILLSVGYSACHWCHVMAHESFEDTAIAELMNKLYICIKVDREERPDIDRIYQMTHQLLTQRPGGWPLTVMLTPFDHAPIFAGTYFPKSARHGLTGFGDILHQVANHYRDNRDQMPEHGLAIRKAMEQFEPESSGKSEISLQTCIGKARDQLYEQFDPVHGGFGTPPKFPHPTGLYLLFRASDVIREPNPVEHTLEAMARGGLYDQLGGGFYRYSVDASWTIPHFEKMLYDNAQLLPLYADAAIVSQRTDFLTVASETADWVIREMQSPEGGYYATQDADSEGEEGRFYLWEEDELTTLLDTDELLVIKTVYGIAGKPNFEGRWHLNIHTPARKAATILGISDALMAERLARAKRKLLAVRDKRVRPGRDEKILTSWNGLMLGAMARSGRRLARPELVDSAVRALDFIRESLWRSGRLLATIRDGDARLGGYLDDYVFLASGILELLQSRWRTEDLSFGLSLLDTLLDHFQDTERGGFYFTADDHEKLLHRGRPLMDDAIPSGNGVAARVLLALGHLVGETRYLEATDRLFQGLLPATERYPAGASALLEASESWEHGIQTIVIRGRGDELHRWSTATNQAYHPARQVFSIPTDESNLPGLLANRAPRDCTVAYVCKGFSCGPPIESLSELQRELGIPTPPA